MDLVLECWSSAGTLLNQRKQLMVLFQVEVCCYMAELCVEASEI